MIDILHTRNDYGMKLEIRNSRVTKFPTAERRPYGFQISNFSKSQTHEIKNQIISFVLQNEL